MRDLTISQGKSFGSWWVTKCWIDEMIQFMAEQGGFMKQKTTQTPPAVPKMHSTSKDLSRQGSRYSSASDDFNMSHASHSQPDRAAFPSAPAPNNHDGLGSGNGSHDDSGISIRTPDEELPMDKFSFTPARNKDLFAGAE
jgi:regulatory factor X